MCKELSKVLFRVIHRMLITGYQGCGQFRAMPAARAIRCNGSSAQGRAVTIYATIPIATGRNHYPTPAGALKKAHLLTSSRVGRHTLALLQSKVIHFVTNVFPSVGTGVPMVVCLLRRAS